MMEDLGAGKRATPNGMRLLELLEERRIGRLKRYGRGAVLYREGEASREIFAIQSGRVKICGNSSDGRLHTYRILGSGSIAGLTGNLLNGRHDSRAETLENAQIYVISSEEFADLVASDSFFSVMVMTELARAARTLATKVHDLSTLSVQQRLMSSLMRLADEHGHETEHGIRIDLRITHEDLAELVVANRCTTTGCLNELKRQGYIWQEDRHLVIIPFEHFMILDGLSQAVLAGDDRAAIYWAKRVVAEGIDLAKGQSALTTAMWQVDREFTTGRLDLSDTIASTLAMRCAMSLIREQMEKIGGELPAVSRVVIGTVRGDAHDIGKTIVSTLLASEGFMVIDLGVDVSAQQFVAAVDQYKPDIIAMSALVTAAPPAPAAVIEALKGEGLRDGVKVVVGGGGVTQQLADSVQADGYGRSAREAVELARKLTLP